MSAPTFLVWPSLRSRPTTFLASFVSIALATALIGSFATLIETAQADGIAPADQEFLTVMGLVIGSWGAVIALFSLVSTTGIALRHRTDEFVLLRTVGTTRRQARHLIRIETLLVAIAGTTLGAAAAWVGGGALVALIRSNGIVDITVSYRAGPRSLGATAALLVVVSLVAATLAGRKAVREPAVRAPTDGPVGSSRMSRTRIIAGTMLTGAGVTMGALTATVMANIDDPYAPAMTAGSACIVTAAGLAVLAPMLLRWFAARAQPLLNGSGPGELAGFNASRRAETLGGILGAVTVFIAATVGVLMMTGIDGRTLDAIAPDRQEAQVITLLNNVVTGMIGLFAAIMVINTVFAVTGQRHAEFGRLQLVGATLRQIRHAVHIEAWLVASAGLVLGGLASLTTVIPYSFVRNEGIVPDGQLWLPPLLAVIALSVTIGGASTAARRTLRDVRTVGPRAAAAV